jgi:hypothetical protein
MSQAFEVPHVSIFTQALQVIRSALGRVNTLLVHLAILVGTGRLVLARKEVHVRDNLALTLVLAPWLPFASTDRFPHELLNAAISLRHLAVIRPP